MIHFVTAIIICPSKGLRAWIINHPLTKSPEAGSDGAFSGEPRRGQDQVPRLEASHVRHARLRLCTIIEHENYQAARYWPLRNRRNKDRRSHTDNIRSKSELGM